ncbi:MAG: hypothetical protein R3251_03355 [Candidatus Spechtbacterales bacterium]|nr:hypothetical protein [Candidatus Spechtbacterales bacterium]
MDPATMLVALVIAAGALFNALFKALIVDPLRPYAKVVAESLKDKIRRAWERLRDIVRGREPQRPQPQEA